MRWKRLHADTEPSEEREAGFTEGKGSPACSEDEGEEEQTPRVKRASHNRTLVTYLKVDTEVVNSTANIDQSSCCPAQNTNAPFPPTAFPSTDTSNLCALVEAFV